MLEHCLNCHGKLHKQATERIRHVAGHAFTAELPAQVCPSCDETYLADDVVAEFDLLVAVSLAEAGVADHDALKFMRKVCGLNGKEFAELLEVRPETVSRWEQGKRPIDRSRYAVLRQLLSDRMHGSTATADYLRSLRKPKRLPKRVKMTIPHAALLSRSLPLIRARVR